MRTRASRARRPARGVSRASRSLRRLCDQSLGNRPWRPIRDRHRTRAARGRNPATFTGRRAERSSAAGSDHTVCQRRPQPGYSETRTNCSEAECESASTGTTTAPGERPAAGRRSFLRRPRSASASESTLQRCASTVRRPCNSREPPSGWWRFAGRRSWHMTCATTRRTTMLWRGPSSDRPETCERRPCASAATCSWVSTRMCGAGGGRTPTRSRRPRPGFAHRPRGRNSAGMTAASARGAPGSPQRHLGVY